MSEEAPQIEMLETPSAEGQEPAAAEPESEAPHQPDDMTQAKELAQKRIDELTWKMREAERQRDRAWEVLFQKEKDFTAKAEAPAAPVTAAKPRYEDFDNDGDYQEALVEWKAEEIWQKKEAQRKADEDRKQRSAEEQKAYAWFQEARRKYPDFDAVAVRDMSEVPITKVMFEAMTDEEMGADVAYYLGKHPQEAHKIAALKPASQAAAIGKLAIKLEQNKLKPKTQTAAPSPTQPVSGKGAVGKSIEQMTAAEYIAYQNEREFGASRK